ncbi:MAG: 30S ribosomal protein S4e [Candidatus Aenigmarchaeota archaeon]|nr:30S ribosomal protein S4e [Candidatus Aenigmarchaeota archaeon]
MAWLKRLATPKWWPIKRKVNKFVAVPRGPYSECLPLVVIIRDVFGVADNGREAKKVIKAGDVLIDGVKRKDPNFGVGKMSLIEIPKLNKSWRVVSRKGFTFVETTGDDSKLKVCKILDKTILKGAKIQLNLDGGRNLITTENYSTGDSLVLKMPEQQVVDVIKMDKGSLALVSKGKKAGKFAVIDEIDNKNRRAWLKEGEKRFEVPLNALLAIGKDKPLVKLE